MTNWIPNETKLDGEIVTLIPLQVSHFESLTALARDERIWEHYVYDGSNEIKFISTLQSAIQEREKGSQFPFVIILKSNNEIIGSTRLMDIQQHHKKLEIGTTWLHPKYWGSAINLECKFLLLTFCFEQLGTFRVQLKTDENNIRSRKAIEKVGGKFEGILRNDMVRDNQSHRHSALYSIISSEWPEAKASLIKLLENKSAFLLR